MNKIDLCKTIQMNVSKLTESENLELFKIILDTKANYTKNNNGIFLNLNWIDEKLLVKINNYILFCIKSQNEISKYELMKTLLNDSINTKDTSDTCDSADINNTGDIGNTKDANEVDETTLVNASNTETGANATNATNTFANAANATNAANAANAVNATNTDNTTGALDSSGQVISTNSTNSKQKFSSSMKFYLLKKKFMKQNTNYNTCLDNDLSYEDYLIT
uniref:NET domain-containing protein n=1 Tax=viral metagenome TaxID=1070528 RepID=A0A6C0K698_9ZZZZ